MTDEDVLQRTVTALSQNAHWWWGPVAGDLPHLIDVFRMLIQTSQMDVALIDRPKQLSDVPRWWLECPSLEVLDVILRNQDTRKPLQSVLDATELLLLPLDSSLEFIHTPGVLLKIFGIV